MTELKKFSDDVIKGKWARIVMSDGSPCYLAIGPRSIVIKKSKSGIIGRKCYEIRSLKRIEQMVLALDAAFPQDLTPVKMTNRILKPLVNAVLHCHDITETVDLFKRLEIEKEKHSKQLSSA